MQCGVVLFALCLFFLGLHATAINVRSRSEVLRAPAPDNPTATQENNEKTAPNDPKTQGEKVLNEPKTQGEKVLNVVISTTAFGAESQEGKRDGENRMNYIEHAAAASEAGHELVFSYDWAKSVTKHGILGSNGKDAEMNWEDENALRNSWYSELDSKLASLCAEFARH